MHLLVFQHVEAEHPAAFAKHMAAAGDTFDTVRFFANDTIPDFSDYDALLVMGGPMDVWETKVNPWLIQEKAAIRTWLQTTGKPYLGICLGHQLLVDAMGGTCTKMALPELALSEIHKTNAAQSDAVFAHLPESFKALHWHGVEASILPPNATVLAQNEACGVQAIRVGSSAWGMQFHPEIIKGLIPTWLRNPDNAQCAESWLHSATATKDLSHAVEAYVPEALTYSKTIYTAFRKEMG
ncbi:type 1 glutamine amidotransferase [Amylibacter sp. IMCC11727]|uniref:type 1 glutamine amidotransferase n=1 Tax=Amylibacter sp. IMCC11727 TaxID=3039851 RepID=UPI00244DB7D5|nr:type 1 glutamine amidotransferase [Amylibacter sp. IMCC11727]WGI22101.1 type 1 glutamine amidotransferase [Amylibacter sp. IMCC11727]